MSRVGGRRRHARRVRHRTALRRRFDHSGDLGAVARSRASRSRPLPSSNWIIPIAVLILIVLFVIQRRGTAGIAKVFGPIMVVWFTVLGVLGVNQIRQRPR